MHGAHTELEREAVHSALQSCIADEGFSNFSLNLELFLIKLLVQEWTSASFSQFKLCSTLSTAVYQSSGDFELL